MKIIFLTYVFKEIIRTQAAKRYEKYEQTVIFYLVLILTVLKDTIFHKKDKLSYIEPIYFIFLILNSHINELIPILNCVIYINR